jgi:acetyl esterase
MTSRSASPLDKLDIPRLFSDAACRSPEMEAVFAFVQAEDAKLPDQSKMSLAEQRAVRAVSSRRWNSNLPPVRSAERFAIPGLYEAPEVPVELITPDDCAPGCIVYMHGGGWTFGSLDSHANIARNLAIATKTRVLSVDYRLAPEHPFPAALDDVAAALRYVTRRGESDPDFAGPIGAAGDSAGANLALATTMREGQGGRARPSALLLFYGVWGCDFETPSYQRFGAGFGLGRAGMEKFLNYYAPGGDEPGSARYDPLVTPLLASEASLAKLPPVYLNAAGLDPLLSDTIAMARLLDNAGAVYDIDVHEGVHHGFMQITERLTPARRAYELVGDFWRKHAR